MFLHSKHSKKGLSGRFVAAISVILTLTVVLSMAFLSPSAATSDANFKSNYPLLSHFSSGNIPDESIWDYSVKEFSEKADFETSQSDFAAPDYKVTATATEGKFTWTAVNGAASYKLKIFDSSNVLFGEFSAVTNEVTVPNFTLGATYQAQVTAYSGETLLCASKIRVFEVVENPVPTLIKADVDGVTNTGWKNELVDKASAPSGKAYSYTTTTQKYFNGKLQGITNFPSEAQAIVFWFGQDINSKNEYIACNFYLDFSSVTEVYGEDTSYYFIPTVNGVPTGEVSISSSKNNSSTLAISTFDSSGKHGSFIEGYIVMPLTAYNNATFNAIDALSSFDLSIKTSSTKSYLDAQGNVTSKNTTTITSGQNIYLSDLGFITDVSDYLVDLGVRAKDTGAEFVEETEFGCNTYGASTNTYYYANKADNLYALSSTKLTFKATDSAGLWTGLSIRFTAPKTKLYDFTQDIAVTGNSSGLTGKVYYRVVIEGGSGDVNAYPASGWHTLDVTTTTPNPDAKLDPILLNLNEGQTARIEAYADLDEGQSGEALTLWLGNPVMTEVESTDTAQGANTKYTASHYFLTPQLNSAANKKFDYYERGNRFTFKLLDATSETLAANNGEPTVSTIPKYIDSWGNALNTSSTWDGEYLGFWYMDNYSGYDNNERLKFKTKTGKGEDIGFVSPVDGTLNFTYDFTGVTATMNVRIVKDGTVVWPQDGGWNQIKTGTVNFTCKASEGDRVSVQFYTPNSGLISGYLNPIVSVLSSDYQNSADSHIYSPLWERPYKGTGYAGDYAAYTDSVFNFELFRTGDLTHLDVDKFDTAANNRLYRDDTPGVGYHFGADELTFDLFSTEYGMTYSFTAPMEGTYDFSSAFRILSGTGKVSFKVAKDSVNIYPTVSSYEVIDSQNDPERLIDALEVTLKEGETINITAFAQHLDASTGTEGDISTDEEQSTEINIVLGMGAPTIIRHINIERQGADTLTIYTPVDFAAFETGHSGAYINMTRRFAYSFISKANGKVTLSDKTDSNSNTISATGIGNFNITESEIIANIENSGYMASMKFISPIEAEADLVFSAFAAGATGKYKVLVNGAVQNGGVDFTALPDNNSPIGLKLTLKKNDVVELIFSLDAAGGVSLGSPEIFFTSRVPDYTSADNSYNPIANNPFGDQDFEGEYVYKDVEYWRYDMIDVADTANLEYYTADSYKSGVPNRLWSTETGTAYLIGETLNVELKNGADDKYGMSLGFNLPRVDDFQFHTGLGIASENTSADLHARITLNGLTVWPTDSETGWYDTTLSTGDSVISVPLYAFGSTSSDELRFEVYTDNIETDGAEAEDLVINLAIPEVYTQTATLISTDDTHTNILNASANHQYSNSNYSGATIPVESRWNFETAVFGEDGYTVRYPNQYNSSTSVYSYEGEERAPTMAASKNTAVIYTGGNEGINLRFASTADAVTYYRNIPTVTPKLDTTEVYFRILLNGEKIWPEGDAEWEVLTKANPTSAVTMSKHTLAYGDDIEAQLYAAAPEGAGADTVSVEWKPLATVANFYSTGNSLYLLSTGFTPTIQVSPFWSYEYAMDRDNIEYELCETFHSSWKYWYSNKKNYIGIAKDRMQIQNVSGGTYGEFETMPIVSLKFTAPQDGYYKPYKTTVASVVDFSNDITSSKIRILVNDEVVWPEEGDWFVLETGKEHKEFFGSIHLTAGDVVRFEATSDGILPGGSKFKVKWPIGLSYSLYDQVYTSTNDIFNMLTTEMYNHFKSLDSTGQFDPDFLANKRLSELLRLEAEQQGSDNEDEEDFDEDLDFIIPDAEGGEGDGEGGGGKYITTGGGRKKLVRRITTNGFPLWLIILIIVAAVLVVAAIVVVLIILKKKGKLTRAKKN